MLLKRKMFKVTITCVVVYLIIVVSCHAASIANATTKLDNSNSTITLPKLDNSNSTSTTPKLDISNSTITSTKPVESNSTLTTTEDTKINLTAINQYKTGSSLSNDILQLSTAAIYTINKLLENPKSLINALARKGCDAKQHSLSSFLSLIMKSLLIKVANKFHDLFTEIKISEVPNVSGTFYSRTNISEFKLKNIVLKGLDNVNISLYDMDLCKLSSEIELTIPKFEMIATYTLKGIIDGSPISGAGNFKMDVDSLFAYEESFMKCSSTILSDDGCRYINKNKTLDWAAEKMTVKLSGIEFEDQPESKINERLNEYIFNYLESENNLLINRVADMLMNYKKKLIIDLSPVKLLNILKSDMVRIQNMLVNDMPLLRNSIFLRFLSIYL